MPKTLHNIEGIRVEDLGALTYDTATDCLVCNTEIKNEDAIAQHIAKDVADITKELGELASEQSAEGLTIEWGSGFPGQ